MYGGRCTYLLSLIVAGVLLPGPASAQATSERRLSPEFVRSGRFRNTASFDSGITLAH